MKFLMLISVNIIWDPRDLLLSGQLEKYAPVILYETLFVEELKTFLVHNSGAST